ncbi:MAG: Rab family GTPase [Promethearchaeota archaeon]
MSYNKKDVLYSFKIVICGDKAVGKTCLFNRYCFNSFDFDTSSTIGINFHSVYLNVNLKDGSDDLEEKYILNSIFDFGGQERFMPLIPKFIEGANGALLVFDSVNSSSFNQLDFWYEQLKKNALNPNIPIILVGSKSDLIDKTPVSEIVDDKRIHKYVEEKRLNSFYRTSSLENYNVLEVFKELNNFMLKKHNMPYDLI